MDMEVSPGTEGQKYRQAQDPDRIKESIPICSLNFSFLYTCCSNVLFLFLSQSPSLTSAIEAQRCQRVNSLTQPSSVANSSTNNPQPRNMVIT